MNKFFISLIALAAISCVNPEANATGVAGNEQETPSSFKNVQVTDLYMAIENEEDIIILDVRTSGEVSQGYVENAKNLDVNETTFMEDAAFLDKSKPVFVYCRSGHRSEIASKK